MAEPEALHTRQSLTLLAGNMANRFLGFFKTNASLCNQPAGYPGRQPHRPRSERVPPHHAAGCTGNSRTSCSPTQRRIKPAIRSSGKIANTYPREASCLTQPTSSKLRHLHILEPGYRNCGRNTFRFLWQYRASRKHWTICRID